MKKKKYKKRVVLSHEEKRKVAKEVIDGRSTKQIAADWKISLTQVQIIIKEYLVVVRVEKYPDQREFNFAPGMRPECTPN